MVLDIDQLEKLEEALRPVLTDGLLEILTKLNREEKLEDFLRMIGKESLLQKKQDLYWSTRSGYIVVLGESQIKVKIMQGILKELGIRKERLECYLGYEEAKTFPYKKIQYQPRYSLILVGSMGHKAQDIGDHSSAITMMEQEEGFPPVRRLGSNNLKITKSNFKEALQNALKEGIIQRDTESSDGELS